MAEKKGKWIKSTEVETTENYITTRPYYKCSVCGYEPRYEGKPMDPITYNLVYCSCCGAKMEK